MTKLKVKGLKRKNVKVRQSILHFCLNNLLFGLRSGQCVRVGVFTSQSRSGLCPIRNRTDGIRWRKFRPAANRRESRIGVVGSVLESGRFRSVIHNGKIHQNGFFSSENSLDLAEISPNLVRSR